jgi:hypothetical protein
MSGASVASTTAAPRDTAGMLLRVAWASIVLGLLMQVLTMLAAGALGALAEFVRDLAQKITWSGVVCSGLALGTAASRARPAWTGLAGLLAAPLAFILARAAHKGVGSAVNAPVPDMAVLIFWTLLLLKALEYGLLGLLLARVAERYPAAAHARTFALVGLSLGVVFGAAICSVAYFGASKPPPFAKLVGQAINEVVFPIGCALVIYGATRLAPTLSPAPRG